MGASERMKPGQREFVFANIWVLFGFAWGLFAVVPPTVQAFRGEDVQMQVPTFACALICFALYRLDRLTGMLIACFKDNKCKCSGKCKDE